MQQEELTVTSCILILDYWEQLAIDGLYVGYVVLLVGKIEDLFHHAYITTYEVHSPQMLQLGLHWLKIELFSKTVILVILQNCQFWYKMVWFRNYLFLFVLNKFFLNWG